MVYETWIGPTYLSGLAGQLGVSIGLLSLFTAVPWLGSVGQLVTSGVVERVPSIKRYVVMLAAGARSLWVLPVVFAWYWGVRASLRGEMFPASRWFVLTVIVATVSAGIGSSSGVAWFAWVKELVPESFRGRFFGVRLRFTMAAVIIAHGIAACLIGWQPGGFPAGFGLMLCGALACAAISTFCLTRVPEIEASPQAITAQVGLGEWWKSLRQPLEDRRFRNIVLFGAIFNGTIQMAGPFFPYYFTKELGIPLGTIAFWTTLSNVGWFAAAVHWGKRVDRAGERLSPAFWVATHLICLSPALYVLPGTHWVRWIAPVDYLTNGMAWSGYNLMLTTLLLRACPRGRCAIAFSVNAAATGLAGAAGNFLGAELATALHPIGGFRALWWITTATRLCVLWSLYRLLLKPDSARSLEAGPFEAEPA